MTVTWDWTRSLFWGWSEELLIKSSCLLYWFSLSPFSLSSSILKRSRDVKLLRSLLSDVLSFAVFLGLTNFSVWELSLLFLFWKYWLLRLEFSIISLMIVPLLQTSFFRNSISSIKLLINALFSLFDKICFC